MSFWQAGVLSFDLLTLEVKILDAEHLNLTGEGTVSGVLGLGPGKALHAEFDLSQDGGDNFSYVVDSHTNTFDAPDGGSALSLLVVGLIGLVAVEGLRRKIATRQNRYA
jgi:hypothetical protein